MFVIRGKQMEALGLATAASFPLRLAEFLRETFPRQTAALDGPALVAFAGDGIERAEGHGIETERDICKYLSLMVTFGRDFDEDPAFPWVAPILLRRDLGPTLRINRLCLEALRHEHEAPAHPATGAVP
ncbi:hypothetical protein JY651_27685 [Pyxidicoccus parkwayensis]|uniref:Uncharacterized protein n=1 Tax=Pyxidicoccus parkwayensis TaxID=2813578 RepID=A0ABX7NNU0_9BACT|nr:hypothetical protein [Pyxidicoccus parkwaysis]QSQ19129.1 hypothetical protein JY651_27685 [Pyxidicoccus parkwaysis]